MALEKVRKEDNQEDQLVHVLVVDDYAFDRILLKRLLTILSYHVTSVESAEKALEYLGLIDTTASPSPSTTTTTARQYVKVNLIMTDYSMPGMTGYDLLQRVKNSSWKDVPVVVVSSEDAPSRITKCMLGGAEGFLSKPVTLPVLENLLRRLLKPKDSISKNDDNGNKRKTTSTNLSSEVTKPKFRGSTVCKWL